MQSLPTRVEVILTDASGSSAAIALWAKPDLEAAVIDAGLDPLIAAASALSDAVVTRTRISYRRTDEMWNGEHNAGDNKEAGVFIYNTADDMQYALIEVHALKSTLLVPSGNGEGVLIDLTIGEVSAFIDLLIESGVTNPFAEVVTEILAAYRQSRV